MSIEMITPSEMGLNLIASARVWFLGHKAILDCYMVEIVTIVPSTCSWLLVTFLVELGWSVVLVGCKFIWLLSGRFSMFPVDFGWYKTV